MGIFQNVYFSPHAARSVRGFFFELYPENLVRFFEVNSGKCGEIPLSAAIQKFSLSRLSMLSLQQLVNYS